MGMNYKEKLVLVPHGFVCDKCGTEHKDEELHDPVYLKNNFGYHSDHDGETVEAYVCEECFYEIMKGIKGAMWEIYG
jgi:hypothetical protein